MADKNLFKSTIGRLIRTTDTRNSEHAPAYALDAKAALAQYAATGCMNGTFYASQAEQLDAVLTLCEQVDPQFIARTALYCRQRGHMKDVPALLCAVLSVRGPGLLYEIFDRVIDNGKMLRNFVQIIRSGVVGRKSLGSLPKRLVRTWFERRDDDAIFRASIGQSPSFADILKMVHPKPSSPAREALFGYLLGRDVNEEMLSPLVRSFLAFKRDQSREVPDVPFQMLTSLRLSKAAWVEIARHGSWQSTRMNLNTFARHGVFGHAHLVRMIAERLRDAKAIEKARVFPYQLMAAYMAAGAGVPHEIRDALQDAMEHAIANVPALDGKVYVFPDVSGSMQSPVTGRRAGATTAVRCVDVAALVAAAVLRRNPQAEVIPFSDDVVRLRLNPRDSIMSNATILASLPSGGTNCSAPLVWLNQRKAQGDLVIFVSDNESWVDAPHAYTSGGTRTITAWSTFKERNANARMVCIDIQPNQTTQAYEREDILNIGGFSDAVFDVISTFATGGLSAKRWIEVIESVQV